MQTHICVTARYNHMNCAFSAWAVNQIISSVQWNACTRHLNASLVGRVHFESACAVQLGAVQGLM